MLLRAREHSNVSRQHMRSTAAPGYCAMVCVPVLLRACCARLGSCSSTTRIMRHPRANVLYVQNNDSFLSAPVPCPKPFRNKHLGVIVDKARTQGNAWRRGLRCPLCRIFTVGRKRVDSQRGRLTPYLSLARPNAARVFLRVRFAGRSLPVRPFQARRAKPRRPGTPAQ